jgi:hypothetical protein
VPSIKVQSVDEFGAVDQCVPEFGAVYKVQSDPEFGAAYVGS